MAETITNQDDVTSQNEDAQTEENRQAQDLTPEEPLEIPKKFVGKPPQEVLRAYNNLEREFHKVSSERADERKNREQLESKIREIEAKLNAVPTQVPQQVRQDEEELDPLEDYDAQFEADPKGAIKSVIEKTTRKQKLEILKAQMEAEAREANAYYAEKKSKDQDFVKLEPKMQSLAREYADLVRPERINSTKALKLLHLAARGASVDDYVSEAVTRAKKESQSVREEKRQAFSESTGTKGDDRVDFKDLSVEEMAKLLGRSDD